MYALAGFSRPSLSNKYSAQYDNLYHSFQYNGDVWMGPVWLPEAASRDDPSLVNNRNSSVAVDATGRAHVVWIAYDKSRDIDVVVHRSRYNNEWSSYSIFIDDVGRAINLQASVCAHHDASTGGVSMFWSDGDVPFVFDQLAVEGYTFNNWKYTAFGAVANDPNAAALAPPHRIDLCHNVGNARFILDCCGISERCRRRLQSGIAKPHSCIETVPASVLPRLTLAGSAVDGVW